MDILGSEKELLKLLKFLAQQISGENRVFQNPQVDVVARREEREKGGKESRHRRGVW